MVTYITCVLSGSRYIIDRLNVVVYGGTKNYHGYHKEYRNNLFIRPDIGCGNTVCGENDASGVSPGGPRPLSENWYNNTCVTAGTPYKDDVACKGAPDANSTTAMQYRGNTFLTPSGDPEKLMVSCTKSTAADAEAEGLTNVSFSKWQTTGRDKGSTVAKWPEPAALMTMARKLLNMKS